MSATALSDGPRAAPVDARLEGAPGETTPTTRADAPPLSPGTVAVLAVSTLLTALVPLVATLDLALPARAVLASAYVLGVPGTPVALSLRLPSRLLTAALAVAVSLAVWITYGTIAVVTGWWHPVLGAWLVSASSLAFVVLIVERRLAARPPLPAAGWVGLLDDGRELSLDTRVALGRGPVGLHEQERQRFVEVDDPTRTVSRLHVELGVDAAGPYVVDRQSFNGVTVSDRWGIPGRCSPDERLHLRDGDTVFFGPHSLRVTHPVVAGRRRAGLPSPRSWGLIARRSWRGRPRFRVAGLAVLLLAALLWSWSTRHLDLDHAGPLGLLPVAGWRYVAALALLAGVLTFALLRRRVDHVVLTAASVLLTVVGYATVAVSDHEGSVPVGWVHVGFIQYISEHGAVPASVDARFSWPGFFSASAQLVALAGTPDSRGFLVPAPVVYGLAALPALLLIARTITRSWRWSWVAVLVYLLTNWYQQDYFSPQATAFVMYVTVLAALLWMVGTADVPTTSGSVFRRARQMLARTPGLPPGVSAGTAQALLLTLALVVVGLVLGHQLTPLNLTFGLLAFTLTGMTRYRLLWMFSGVVFAGWFSYGALDFWAGHLSGVVGEVGQVQNAIDSSVAGRLTGNVLHQQAQFVRIVWSVLLFGVAGLGLLVLRRRRDVLLLAALAGAPFGLLLVQSYGGEVIIRCFLYSSPLLAPLSAVALRRAGPFVRRLYRGLVLRGRGGRVPRGPRWARVGLVGVALLVAGLVLTFTRGLNVAFERAPEEQAVASQLVYDLVRPGDSVTLPTSVGLSPYLDVTEVGVDYLDLEECETGTLAACVGDSPSRFVLVTLTQERSGELTEGRPEGWVWGIADRLVGSREYVPVYDSPEARLLERVGGEGR